MATTTRTYADGCSSAFALDLVGGRWALLIVRELLLGPKRFSDLRVGLPDGSANVLTQRLRELEASGVVRRRVLPPPAASTVYELTEWGAELEPVVLGLQRWGAGSPQYQPTHPVGCDSAMLALKGGFDPTTAVASHRVEVRFATGTFAVLVDAASQTLWIDRGAADDPEVIVTTTPGVLEELAFTPLTVAAAQRRGDLQVIGEPAAAQAFFDLFGASAD